MDDHHVQLSPDNSFLDDLLNYFDEPNDYAIEFVTNPPQDHPALPEEEPVENSIPMDGCVMPLPPTEGDAPTTDPQPDSAHRHNIILDPIFETFFKRHDESPQSPTSDVQPLQDNLSDSVEPSKPTPHSTQQHLPPTSQCLEVPISTSQSLENVSTQQHVHVQQYQPKPTPLQSLDSNNQIIQSPTPPNKRQKISSKRCGCKVSKCQKRYCECYASGEFCGQNCSCQGCFNKSEYEATEKGNNNMCHNPLAMYGAPTLNSFAPSAAATLSPLPAFQMAVMAQPRAYSGVTHQPQQQHMLMNPANPQQMIHRAFSVNSGFRRSTFMQLPPRLRQEANKINLYWKQLPRE